VQQISGSLQRGKFSPTHLSSGLIHSEIKEKRKRENQAYGEQSNVNKCASARKSESEKREGNEKASKKIIHL